MLLVKLLHVLDETLPPRAPQLRVSTLLIVGMMTMLENIPPIRSQPFVLRVFTLPTSRSGMSCNAVVDY